MLKKVVELCSKQKESMDVERRILLNKQMALERKRGIAEEKLLSGVLPDKDFKRIREKLEEALSQIRDQVDELDRQRDLDVDVVRAVLKYAKNIYETYKQAPHDLKRLLLGLFWDKFWVQDREIAKAEPNKLIQAFIENKEVIISNRMCASSKLIITLKDWRYMDGLREKIREIKNFTKSLEQ